MSGKTSFGDPDKTILIPSRELTGTRESKLAELDTFLAQLHMVRLALSGQPIRLEGFVNASGTAGKDPPDTHVWTRPLRRVQRMITSLRRSAHQATRSRNL